MTQRPQIVFLACLVLIAANPARSAVPSAGGLTSPRIEIQVPLKRDQPRGEVEATAEWLSIPNLRQMAEVYPAEAAKSRLAGRVQLDCQVTAKGYLEACKVLSEGPAGAGFGPASQKLIPYFRLRPGLVQGQPAAGRTVFSIDFEYPSS